MSSWTLAVQGFYPSFSAAIDVVLVSGTISDPSQLPWMCMEEKLKEDFKPWKLTGKCHFLQLPTKALS